MKQIGDRVRDIMANIKNYQVQTCTCLSVAAFILLERLAAI